MKSRRGIECDFIVIKDRHMSLQRHHERLQKIQHTEPKRSNKILHTPQRIKSYGEVGRKIEIERSNQILLEKLIDINKRHANKEKRSSKSMTSIKSLNESTRKTEAQRIRCENELISKRIITQKPLITTKRVFDREFEMYKKYCNLLSRKHFLKYNEFFPLDGFAVRKKNRSKTPPPLIGLKTINTSISTNIKPIKKDVPEPSKNLMIEDDSSYEDDFQ